MLAGKGRVATCYISKNNHKRYNTVHVTLTASPPPPKTWKTPSYHLEQYTIRRYKHTVNVQIRGIRGREKRTESISFPLLPTISDADLVRAATWFSPNKWTISFGKNVSEFQGKFSYTPDQELLNALMDAPHASPARGYQQPSPPAYEAPTQANTSPPYQAFPPPYPQAGQFQQPFSYNASPPSASRRNLWQWYKSRTGKVKLGLGYGALIAALLFFVCIGSAIGSSNLASTPPTPTPTTAQAAVLTTPVVTDTPAPTPIPKHKPTPTPTPKPTMVPTRAPQPTRVPPTPIPPSCQGVNGNPWCYNFAPGKLIYYPPAGFCNYFACIPSFYGSDDPGDGYIVECTDGTYSQSGGESGACSYHSGVMRPLYSH